MRPEHTRIYPDDPVGLFPTPPTTYTDPDARTIEFAAIGDREDESRRSGAGGRGSDATDTKGRESDGTDPLEALTEMYAQFDPADRAQGIPPTGRDRIRQWLKPLLENGINVVGSHDGEIIGHATLVPDTDEPSAVEDPGSVEWELAIFVLQAYQRGGIGTQLLELLLGHAATVGVDHVWLTVERWNGPAIALYERVGFELCGAESFEQEMSIRLQ
ncbi:GNAT family N-acetyltransferase [Natronosalvus vescus]|uniref:GNAT family N-acetyltransferase n=1 Tax=Natronosalvus vescus TaxID=2953881 RepID=UPI0020900D1F|nr:GNAT family N-acetyltransferase [Natronosalvus vescus]